MKFADRMDDMELSGIRNILDLAEKMKDPATSALAGLISMSLNL